VVFDSFSTDRTVEIARAAGARVIQRAFDDERSQRTASLRVPFRHRWVYNPDADEILTPGLRDEMLEAAADASRPEVAYRVRFKTMFCGRWIRRSSLYPTWVVRLLRPEYISFERSVNLRYLASGSEGRLRGHFEHHTFHKGIAAWLEKHNRYSSGEAAENLRFLSRPRSPWTNLLSRAPVLHRRALKELSYGLPFRPLLRFIYMYLFRLGFLDGRPGFDYCVLLSLYESMIVLKINEMRRATALIPQAKKRWRFSPSENAVKNRIASRVSGSHRPPGDGQKDPRSEIAGYQRHAASGWVLDPKNFTPQHIPSKVKT
jgi:glycosyltransferase involved in cell wall biosynthesis